MTPQQGFPKQLLNQSPEDRLTYFEQHKIDHPMLKKVFNQLLDAVDKPDKGSLLFLYGPTGVGKTTLIEKIIEKLIERSLEQLEIDRGRVPVVALEAVAPESGNFNWKDFFIRALTEFEEPLIDYKIDYGEKGISRNQEGEIVIESRIAAHALHRSLEKCLKYRCPDIFLIDEAHHFGIMSSGQKLKNQLECLKSIANMSSTNLGLLGTYDLLIFRNLGGQLSRRSIDIHFPRYKVSNKQDLKAFVTVLKTFQKHLPLSEEPDLLTN
ncbi:MAG: AAA family ATPase [Cyanobacteria bacterium P01_A01_bin.83]